MSTFGATHKVGSPTSKLAPISIPKVLVTNEDSATPSSVQDKDFAMMLLQRHQGYCRKDEDSSDAGSTAPLLDSGAATPLCEEPSIPLNMRTFLASSQKLKAEISSSEEICLSSLDGDKDVENKQDNSSDNQLDINGDYPFVKWQWKHIRIFTSLLTLLAILGCFGSSFTFIAHLPQRCDPAVEWWQGKLFYALDPHFFHDSDGDGQGDIPGIVSKLDYLSVMLHANVVHLGDIFEVIDATPDAGPTHFNCSKIDPRIGDIIQLVRLIENLEKRNMSLVIDFPISQCIAGNDRDIRSGPSSHLSHHQHIKVENLLRFWLQQGVHGFYLKDLEKYAHQELWKNIVQWKNVLDSFSSDFSKRRIFICSSDFLQHYYQLHPLSVDHALRQFDLVDNYLDVSNLSELGENIREGIQWDNGINNPWILWNVGTLGKPRIGSVLQRKGEGCISSVGAHMLAMALPGSTSIYFGEESDLRISMDDGASDDSEDLSYKHLTTKNIEKPNFPNLNLEVQPGERETDVRSDCQLNTSSVEILGLFSSIRADAVPLYVNAVLKFDNLVLESRSSNYLLRILGDSSVVIERYYPRRHRYLFIANLGPNNVTHDLSNTYFGGQTLVSSSGTKHDYVKLDRLSLVPGEGLLLLLDK